MRRPLLPAPRTRVPTGGGMHRLLSGVWTAGGALFVAACASETMAPPTSDAPSLVIVSGNNQAGEVGKELPLPLVVKATNPNGSVIANLTIDFHVTGGAGSMYVAATSTNGSGIARNFWTLGTVAGAAQTLEVRAILSNGTRQVLGRFSATAVAGPAATVAMSGGDNQVAPAGSAVGAPPAVFVSDRFGNPVSGLPVNFTVSSGGGTLTGASPTTDAQGVATVGGWTLGNVHGLNSLTATVAGSGIAGNPITITAQSLHSLRFGAFFSCGLTQVGAAYCWGDNSYGTMGNGSPAFRFTSPTPVSGGLTFTDLTAQNSHACGLTSLGAAYCWGYNGFGELGDGTHQQRNTPVPVVGSPRFTSLVSGDDHTCGLAVGGTAYCWGADSAGQLGAGGSGDRSTPVAVAGGLSFVSLTSGEQHTCGLTTGKQVYCWGYNSTGQLGDGSTTNSLAPIPVLGGLHFESVMAGWNHTCALTATGAAYCWGSNYAGQLGDGTAVPSRSSPVPVTGGIAFASLTGGYAHTCGLTSAGIAYCWGGNFYGQLGDGTLTSHTSPTLVAWGGSFVELSAGYWQTCGLEATGTVDCWGWNWYGQLGDGTTVDHPLPAPVIGGVPFF